MTTIFRIACAVRFEEDPEMAGSRPEPALGQIQQLMLAPKLLL